MEKKMIINGTRTKLKKGDLLILRPRQKTISFFRGGRALLFSNNDDRRTFPWGDEAFAELIILLSETHGFAAPPTRMNEIEFSTIKIKDEECISFRF